METFDNYEGEEGMYAKTFLINDKWNVNRWRVSWDSIKDYAKTFVGRPGIEYQPCPSCKRDHPEGTDFKDTLDIQEQYRKSTIIKILLDEANRKAMAIHKVHDKELWERMQQGRIQYVSPAVLPIHASMYHTAGGNHTDATDWEGLHLAFVDIPAYGEPAHITHTCQGSDCQGALLKAAIAPIDDTTEPEKHNDTGKDEKVIPGTKPDGSESMRASEGIANSENLENIQQVRLHTKEKKLKKDKCGGKKVNLKAALEATEMNLLLAEIEQHHRPRLFRPKKGEDPDDGDWYWRTLPDGRKMRFKADEDMTKKLKRWKDTQRKSKKKNSK